MSVGDELAIEYNPRNPANAQTVDRKGRSAPGVVLGIMLILAGICSLLAATAKHHARRDRHRAGHGEAPDSAA